MREQVRMSEGVALGSNFIIYAVNQFASVIVVLKCQIKRAVIVN